MRPGKRFALPHARVLLHQPHGGAEGQAVDIEIQAKEITRSRQLLEKLVAQHTGQPMEKVAKDTDRDFILTAEEAKDYGVIDEIITDPWDPGRACFRRGRRCVIIPEPRWTGVRPRPADLLVGERRQAHGEVR